MVTADDPRYHRKLGWLYMRFYEPEKGTAAAAVAESPESASASTDSTNKHLVMVGSATGFVVHPHYLLTNRHVAAAGDAFLISTSTDLKKTFPAKLVALPEDHNLDLAILRCDELNLAPVPFAGEAAVRRGTEVTVLGFPPIQATARSELITLISTRGAFPRHRALASQKTAFSTNSFSWMQRPIPAIAAARFAIRPRACWAFCSGLQPVKRTSITRWVSRIRRRCRFSKRTFPRSTS